MPTIRFYESSKYYKLIKYYECHYDGRFLPLICGTYNNKLDVVFVPNKDGKKQYFTGEFLDDLREWIMFLGENGCSIKNKYEFKYVLRSIAKDNYEVAMGFMSERQTQWYYIKDKMDDDLKMNYYQQINEYNQFSGKYSKINKINKYE